MSIQSFDFNQNLKCVEGIMERYKADSNENLSFLPYMSSKTFEEIKVAQPRTVLCP